MMEFADLEKLVKTRRSVRKWQERKVPEDLIKKAIELATWAPSGGNQQNWKFYVVLNPDKIKAIANVVRASSQLMASWTEAPRGPATPAPGFGRGPTFFEAAPALVAVAMSPYRSGADLAFEAREKTDPAAARMALARRIADSGVQSVSAAITTLLLVFHQMGLGAVWMTGPIQAKDEIEKVLNVPDGLDVIALIPVGYPDETPQSRGRKPFHEIGEVIL
jgi:nitroreductase